MRSPSTVNNAPVSEDSEQPFPFGEDPSPQHYSHANALEYLTTIRKELSRVGGAAYRGESPAAVTAAFGEAWGAIDRIARNLAAAATELGESVGEYD